RVASSNSWLPQIPALFTRRSILPKCSMVVAIRSLPPSGVDTSLSFAITSPPRDRMRSATSSAIVESLPNPDTSVPRSFTTTRALRSARSSTYARPSPRPAPVTTATFPSNEIRSVISPSASDSAWGPRKGANATALGQHRGRWLPPQRRTRATLEPRRPKCPGLGAVSLGQRLHERDLIGDLRTPSLDEPCPRTRVVGGDLECHQPPGMRARRCSQAARPARMSSSRVRIVGNHREGALRRYLATVTDGAPEASTDCVAGRRKPPMPPRPGVCARGRSALVREAEHSTMDRTGRTAYDRVVISVPQVAQEAIDAAVESALSQALHTDLGDKTHLAR